MEDGYSIVVDEIFYIVFFDELRLFVYVEVEDNLIINELVLIFDRMFERFLFGFFGINFLFIERKLVENFYFDMNDKNVYYEIIDDLIRIENVYVFS